MFCGRNVVDEMKDPNGIRQLELIYFEQTKSAAKLEIYEN